MRMGKEREKERKQIHLPLSHSLTIPHSQIYLPRIRGVPDAFPFYPDRFGLEYEDVWLTASDGTKLHAWLLKPPGTAAAAPPPAPPRPDLFPGERGQHGDAAPLFAGPGAEPGVRGPGAELPGVWAVERSPTEVKD